MEAHLCQQSVNVQNGGGTMDRGQLALVPAARLRACRLCGLQVLVLPGGGWRHSQLQRLLLCLRHAYGSGHAEETCFKMRGCPPGDGTL